MVSNFNFKYNNFGLSSFHPDSLQLSPGEFSMPCGSGIFRKHHMYEKRYHANIFAGCFCAAEQNTYLNIRGFSPNISK